MKTLWHRASTLLTGLVLLVLALEVSLTLGLEHFASSATYDLYASFEGLQDKYGAGWVGTKTRYAPHRYLGYYPTPGFTTPGGDRHNSLGYRGDEIALPKPDGTFRIALLGGSTTYGFGVSRYTESFPYLLQRVLRERGYPRVETINAGASSYSTWESLINLAFRVLELEPDLIVVYHGTNDAALRLVWPASAYRGDNSGAKGPWLGAVEGRSSFLEISTLARVVATYFGWTTPHTDLARHWDKRARTYEAERFERQLARGDYPSGVFASVDAETMLAGNPPVHFERNVEGIVAMAQAQGVSTVLATFAYSPLFPENPRVAHEVFRTAMDEGNEIVRAISARTSAHLFDFAREMPPDRKYYTDGRHFTKEGNELRAELFADYLMENGMIP